MRLRTKINPGIVLASYIFKLFYCPTQTELANNTISLIQLATPKEIYRAFIILMPTTTAIIPSPKKRKIKITKPQQSVVTHEIL